MSTVEKRSTIFTSEQVLTPPVITKEEIQKRIELFSKTPEEKEAIKKAKRHVDRHLGNKNFIEYAKSSEIANSNFTIKLYSKI